VQLPSIGTHWKHGHSGASQLLLLLLLLLLLQVSYGIGLPHPLSVYVDTYKTGQAPDEEILHAVMQKFDFRPGKIMQVRPDGRRIV
jgi:hypothetical protein